MDSGLSKEEIKEIVHDYIKENLTVYVSTSTSSVYQYGGGYSDVPSVEVQIYLDGEVISTSVS